LVCVSIIITTIKKINLLNLYHILITSIIDYSRKNIIYEYIIRKRILFILYSNYPDRTILFHNKYPIHHQNMERIYCIGI